MTAILTFTPFPTAASTSITPTVVTFPIRYDRAGRTILHEVIGAEEPAVTFKVAGSRAGTLVAVFADALDAKQLQDLAALPGYFTATGAELGEDDGLSFVVAGDVARELNEETQRVWSVSIPFREATP